MSDNYLFVINNKQYIEKYNIISEIKIDDDKLVLLVFDKINSVISISKIFFDTDHDLSVYNVLLKNPHKNIEKIIDIINFDDFVSIQIEYINGYNLNKYIGSNNHFLKKIYNDIYNAYQYFISNKIIHGDLKLENIMVFNNTAIIIDFEFAKLSKSYYYSKSSYGSINYLSPESYDLNVYSHYSDIWSIGVVFYKLITNKFPYDIINTSNIRKCLKKINFTLLNNYNYDINKYIRKMLCFVDKERIFYPINSNTEKYSSINNNTDILRK
jgi:serine/threonine protein kinase